MSEAIVAAVQDWSSSNPALAPLIIVLAVAACTVSVFIPTTPLNLAVAATHGILPSALMVCVGCTLGSVVNFAIARYPSPPPSPPLEILRAALAPTSPRFTRRFFSGTSLAAGRIAGSGSCLHLWSASSAAAP